MASTLPTPRRASWLKTLHQWHWISSALSLVGMLLFALTGITLNHAGQIEAQPHVVTRTGQLPPPLLKQMLPAQAQPAPLPAPLQHWLTDTLAIEAGERPAEWSEDEMYLSLPRPGGDAWLRIDRISGEFEYELTQRGWIAYLNDLHKGRNTGTAWSWFIDIFAAACLVFSLTGLLILKMHAANRPTTWPMVGMGLVIPLLLAILFIH